MNRKYEIELLKERIGLSSKFSDNLIIEAIKYVENNDRLLTLGLQGKICKEIRALYYSGYTDLSIPEGVIQILKSIEVALGTEAKGIPEVRVPDPVDVPILNIDQYLSIKKKVATHLDLFTKKEIKRIHRITDVSQLQFGDPLFTLKFAKRKLKKKLIQKEAKINKVTIISDQSNSMISRQNVEKFVGIVYGVLDYFPNAEVSRYKCLEGGYEITPVDKFKDEYKFGRFHLNYYLSNIPDTDLVIVCTDASTYEFQTRDRSTPTILFNIGEDTFGSAINLTEIKL